MHVMPIANVSRSGIKFRMWLERLVTWLKKEGNDKDCPAFCDVDGYMLTTSSLEAIMHPIMESMQGMTKFAETIPVGLEVSEWFRMERSLRRGAENDALDNGTSKTTIELIVGKGETDILRENINRPNANASSGPTKNVSWVDVVKGK